MITAATAATTNTITTTSTTTTGINISSGGIAATGDGINARGASVRWFLSGQNDC